MKTNKIHCWQATLLTIITLVLPLTTINAAVYDMFVSNGINYMVTSEEESTVQTHPYQGSNSIYEGDIIVPSTVEHNGKTYTVTQIGLFSFCQSSITSISLPPTIESIGTNAFTLTNLKEINIPASVKRIGIQAFFDTPLESITFHEGLETIEEQAFSNCEGVDVLQLPQSLRIIDKYAFTGMKSLKTITIPGNVDIVGACAFWGCEGLNEVYVNEGVKIIDDCAFLGCSNIQIMRLPSSITYIGQRAICCSGDVYFSKPFPPNGKKDYYWNETTTKVHIPVGTKQYYDTEFYWNPNYNAFLNIVEDVELGIYCDIKITDNNLGEVLMDTTKVQFYKDFIFTKAGENIVLTFVPQLKHLIHHVTLDGNDITNNISGATLYDDTHEADLSDEIVPVGAYSLNNIQGSINIDASFIKERYTKLAIRQDEGGTITVRLHRDEPLQVELNRSSISDLLNATFNGTDCINSMQGNTFYLGTIDDPATLEIEYVYGVNK
jgi:hypothetical protein